ncbi:uncharacterized protein LOC129595643 [Paramacrobiotus metropolitanus]|uniref:uncharacterized protein LOC129595643 n=1 Tax=Paramacrobiotus metropolitanus TaxID=2943436 RepID=UPI002445E094|nr:uncharacterized protein LOC129595643 [Paramacrobiotus metropolitanus]
MTPPAVKDYKDKEIVVTINGTKYYVPTTFSEVSLNDYLRINLSLTGTKVTCREGGCGVCIVNAAYKDPVGGSQFVERAVNSCLCPILSCDGWEITTVEGIGNQNKPHPLQSRLTDHYGTQCGFCTPGMIMNMYSLLQNGSLTKRDVEDSFDGNICRCTGYRPILDAFKSFASMGVSSGVVDIENSDAVVALCRKFAHTATNDKSRAEYYVRQQCKATRDFAPPWYAPATLNDLYKLLPQLTSQNVYYVVGHTGKGVYDDGPYDAYVNLKNIRDLYELSLSQTALRLGSAIPLKDLIETYKEFAGNDGYHYLTELATLLSKTAHIAVRNVGSWGGNMAMKNRHKEFPSETFLTMAVSNAIIYTGPDNKALSADDFLNSDLKGNVILRAELPAFGNDYYFKTYKVMPRSQNAHAIVNAAFRAKVDKSQGYVITEKPCLIFGNIAANFVHAAQTETFLAGKNLGDVNVLQQALQILNKEVNPTTDPSEARPEARRSICLSLFYKFALTIVGDFADPRYHSATSSLRLERPLSSGTQSYPTKKENWPLTQPIPKIESMVQCTGEAKFIADIERNDLLHAAFVLTTQANATVYRIDTAPALALPGVVRVFTAPDIPGVNNIFPQNDPSYPTPPEELLVIRQSLYAGQPVAIVVAVTRDIAEAGAKLVVIEYSNVRNPILTVQDAIRENSFYESAPTITVGDADAAIASAPRKISGELTLGHQAHYHMETMVAVAYPTENGVDLDAGTQWIDYVQDGVALVTGVPKNRINVSVRRNGGGFGAKIHRNNHSACACAMAAWILKKPVKMHMTLWDNSRLVGKRYAYYAKYNVGFDDNGKLLGVSCDVYCNTGAYLGSPAITFLYMFAENVYKSDNWKFNLFQCKTNIPSNVFMRAPGSFEAIHFAETILEHVAFAVKKPAIEVKQANFLKDGDPLIIGAPLTNCTIAPITLQLLESADYKTRVTAVEQFNKANRWRKRGLGISPTKYTCAWDLGYFNCLVSVYHTGGYVAVTHGGIELGQGINTKVAQVVAYELGIDMKYIDIQPTQGITNPNAVCTGNSITSELACLAAIDCCNQIKANMKKTKDSMPPDSKWEDLVEKAFRSGVNLCAQAWAAPKSADVVPLVQYNTYGTMCTEVEVDVLTGEYQINRVDLLYDCGESMSPLVDVGQVEGAVIMGLGYLTSEEVLFDPKTGENLTYGTWKYKPPTTKDIPIDFRVAILQNAPNPSGVLRSKVVGEPPLLMTTSVIFALRNAVYAQLQEVGKGDVWVFMESPLTVERMQQYAQIDISQMRYKDY